MVDDESIKHSFEISQTESDLIRIVYKEGYTSPEENKRQAEVVEAAVMEIVNQDPSKNHDLLLDITNLNGINYISPEAREIYGGMTKLQQLRKAAVVGSNTFLEIVVNLMMQASGKAANFKWFKNRTEAEDWLKLEAAT